MSFDKKKVKKIFFLFLLISFIPGSFLLFSWYLGFFNLVSIQKIQSTKMIMIVMSHQGNYQRVGQKIIKIQSYLSLHKIKCRPVALYYDDQATVIKKKLRSAGGCIVNKIPLHLPKHYRVVHFKSKKVLKATVSAHPGIANIKLFSAIKKYAIKKNISLIWPAVGLFEGKNCFLYFFT